MPGPKGRFRREGTAGSVNPWKKGVSGSIAAEISGKIRAAEISVIGITAEGMSTVGIDQLSTIGLRRR